MTQIIVEVGSDEQKNLIADELRLAFNFYSQLDVLPKIKKIIVPYDFQNTINNIGNRNDFKMFRGIGTQALHVMAKWMGSDEEPILVISPFLYESSDSQMRFVTYFHEIAHQICFYKNPDYKNFNLSEKSYLDTIHKLYEEYYCDRFAYSLLKKIFSSLSKEYLASIDEKFKNYNELFEESEYAELADSSIQLYRRGKINFDEVHIELDKIFAVVAIGMCHYYSLVDEHEINESDVITDKPPFINTRTLELFNYFRSKFEKSEHDLSDGISHIDHFLRNFGLRYEDIGSTENISHHIVDLEY